jgi:uncharacterized protein
VPELDANVLLRHLLADNRDQSPRATALIKQIERGEISAHISDITIQEVVFTLERSYKVPKSIVRESVEGVLGANPLSIQSPARIAAAFEIYDVLNVDFGDAYVAASALDADGEVISFDRDFNRIPGVTRIEP